MFRSHFCTGDAAAADFDILEGRNIFSSGFQCRVSHVRVQGFGGFFTGNGTHLADTASGYAADYIVGKIAALTDGRSVHMAADPSGCSIA